MFHCSKCQNIICSTCKFSEIPVDVTEENNSKNQNENVFYCVQCFSTASVPEAELTTNITPISEMLRNFSQIGSEMRSTDNISDIIDVYEAKFGTNNNQTVYCETRIMNQICTPLLAASYLPTLPCICEFNINTGGRLYKKIC